jgi:O-antigen ligase
MPPTRVSSYASEDVRSTALKIETVIAWWFLLLAVAFPVSIAASSLLYFPLLGLYVLLGYWTFRRWPPQWGAVESAFFIFWGLSVVSAFLGADPWFSRVRLGKDLYFLILILLGAYLARENQSSQLMKVFMVSAAVTACFGILQRMIGVNQSDNAGGVFYHLPLWLAHAPRSLQNHLSMVNGRAVGTRAHPLTYAEGLLFPLGYSLSTLTTRRADWWKWAIVQYLILMGLLVSQSRGPWIAAAVMVFMACLLHRNIHFYVRLFVIYFPIAMCFLFPSMRARLVSIANPAYQSNAERFEMWQAGYRMVQDHPLWGVGTGTMHLVSPHYQSEERRRDGPWGHLHNTYVNVAAERGLLGLAAFLGFIGLLAFYLWRGYQMALGRQEEESKIMMLTGLLGLAGWMVAGATETISHDTNVNMMFYFVMGISLAVSRSLAAGGPLQHPDGQGAKDRIGRPR